MWVSVEATLLAAGDRLSGCEIDGAQARGGVRVRDIAEAFAKGDEGILGGTFERLIVTALNDPSAVGYLPAAALRDCVSSGMDLLLEEFHRRCRTDTSQARRSTAEVEPLKTAYLHAVDIAAEKRDRRAPGRLTQLLNELPTTAVVLDVFGDGWPVDHLLAREVNLPDSLRHFQSADLLIGAPPFVPLDRGSTEGPLRVYFPATVHLAAKRARPTHHAGLPGLQLEIRTSRGWKTRPSADAVLDPIASRIRRRFRAVLEETHPGHDIVIDHLSPLSRAIRASFAAVGCALLGGANEGLLVDFRPARRLLQDAGRPIDDLLTEIRFLAGTSRAG